MPNRLRLKDFADGNYYKELMTTEARIHNQHLTTRMCRESRWPFTDQLSPDQIVLMRDCYMGNRTSPSKQESQHVYDRIFNMKKGWDQMVTGDVREARKHMVVDVRSQDFEKNVPVLTNTTYGHRHKLFYDWLSKSPVNRSEYSVKRALYRKDKLFNLPPLVGSAEHPHLPNYDKDM